MAIEAKNVKRGYSGQFVGSPCGETRPSRKRNRDSTCRTGNRRWGGRGGGGVEEREEWEDLLVTRPESENELSQTNRSV